MILRRDRPKSKAFGPRSLFADQVKWKTTIVTEPSDGQDDMWQLEGVGIENQGGLGYSLGQEVGDPQRG